MESIDLSKAKACDVAIKVVLSDMIVAFASPSWVEIIKRVLSETPEMHFADGVLPGRAVIIIPDNFKANELATALKEFLEGQGASVSVQYSLDGR